MSAVNNDLISKLGLGAKAEKKDDRDPGKVGQDQFLELMLAQMKNQDPMEPMDNGEFLTQIAQFTMASGVSDLNTSFEGVSESVKATQVMQASTLIDRTVLIKSEQVEGKTQVWLGEGGLGGAVELPQATTNLNVEVYNQNGEVVHRINAGDASAGMNYFNWDGKNSEGEQLPAGKYQMTASAQFGNEIEALEPLVADYVTSVSIGAGGTDYSVNLSGAGDTKVSQIRQIL